MPPLPRAICNDLADSTRREWLVTDGLGGYACGTVAGVLARKYHGMLVAATAPPGKRVLLLASLDAEVVVGDARIPLSCHRWADGSTTPDGFNHIESFRLDGMVPTWRYAFGDIAIDRELWMVHGEPTTCVRWTLRRGGPVSLRVRALTSCRSHHAVASGAEQMPRVDGIKDGVWVTADRGGTPLVLRTDRGALAPTFPQRWRNFLLSVERARGYDAIDSHDHVATLDATLQPGESVTIVASAFVGGESAERARLSSRPLEVQRWRDTQREREVKLLATAKVDANDDFRRRLVLAADQFIVRRTFAAPMGRPPVGIAATAAVAPAGKPGPATTSTPASASTARRAGSTIIAGYPWFEDWGRDTMIALPGLCLATGRHDEAKEILRTFAAVVDRGMIPNRFPDEGGAAEYHTIDATLWFVEAVARTHAATSDDAFVRELWPALTEVVRYHVEGTRHGIGVDPADGLLRGGEPGLQLTWMDAKVGDRVVTPRIGKPVEIAALWHSALRRLAGLSERLGAPLGALNATGLRDMAARVRTSFARYRNDSTGCLFDVLDGPRGHDDNDASIRPNQLVAAGLAESPIDDALARQVVDVCSSALLTSHGMRTLSAHDPAYVGHYAGDQPTRDAAYHQGTVWPWLLGPYLAALRRVKRDDPALAALVRDLLEPIRLHLDDAGLGSISEVFDGDAPHIPGGCFAQAWSVGVVLDAMRE